MCRRQSMDHGGIMALRTELRLALIIMCALRPERLRYDK